ncbi:MAG: O-antigen ligase family protein [Acidimicrobiales bacterium]
MEERDGLGLWGVPVLVLVLAAVAGWRDGGFWDGGAAAVAVIAAVLLIAALFRAPPDRREILVVGSLGLLVLWWFVRSVTAGPGADFLPLGASIIGFAAAFAAARPLIGRARQEAAVSMACLGAVGALVGFVGLVWRVMPLALPAQGLWRLSSSVTYADAAGLLFGVCLLLALGCERAPSLVRVVVCLNAAGLLATQSRGAYVAIACACFLVPARRYRDFAVPLLAGAVLGVAAIASSPQSRPVPWLGVVVALAVGVSLWGERGVTWPRLGGWARVAGGGVALGAAVGIAVLVHHEIGLRALAPSDQDRSAESSSALHQWLSSPLAGVGPDRLLELHASDGSSARFVHDEYLQIAADTGIVGLGLVACVALSLAKTLRRSDPLSSCAVAAVVCWAVGGVVDFSWHLPVVGLVGGWCAGLAAREEGSG